MKITNYAQKRAIQGMLGDEYKSGIQTKIKQRNELVTLKNPNF